MFPFAGKEAPNLMDHLDGYSQSTDTTETLTC